MVVLISCNAFFLKYNKNIRHFWFPFMAVVYFSEVLNTCFPIQKFTAKFIFPMKIVKKLCKWPVVVPNIDFWLLFLFVCWSCFSVVQSKELQPPQFNSLLLVLGGNVADYFCLALCAQALPMSKYANFDLNWKLEIVLLLWSKSGARLAIVLIKSWDFQGQNV